MSYIRVSMHFVWATWDHKPSIQPERDERFCAAIAAACKEMNCPAYGINGMADYVYVLVHMDANVSLTGLAQRMKGTTSHVINQAFAPAELFRWQGRIRRLRTV